MTESRELCPDSDVFWMTFDDWARWTDVANAACAEVGATPGWVLDRHGSATDGDTRDHYRSGALADIALGVDRRPNGTLPAGYCVCWPCWEANEAPDCQSVTYESALVFGSCGRLP